MNKSLNIALIAHDRRKTDLCSWVEYNKNYLINHNIICTGTTGRLVNEILNPEQILEQEVKCVNSGPLGGDAEIAAMIVQGQIDLCIFLIDDLDSQPHSADISMLLRQCRIHNIPVACNRYSADLMITSTLWENEDYKPTIPTYVEFDRKNF